MKIIALPLGATVLLATPFWLLVITDTNDANSNGIPDLSGKSVFRRRPVYR